MHRLAEERRLADPHRLGPRPEMLAETTDERVGRRLLIAQLRLPMLMLMLMLIPDLVLVGELGIEERSR